RLIGQLLRRIPLHEVLHDAVLDGSRVLLDPGHDPRREEDVEAEEDQDAEKGDRAGDPSQQEQRLYSPTAPNWSLPLLSQLTDARVAALLVLPRAGASAHSVSSGLKGVGGRASSY